MNTKTLISFIGSITLLSLISSTSLAKESIPSTPLPEACKVAKENSFRNIYRYYEVVRACVVIKPVLQQTAVNDIARDYLKSIGILKYVSEFDASQYPAYMRRITPCPWDDDRPWDVSVTITYKASYLKARRCEKIEDCLLNSNLSNDERRSASDWYNFSCQN